MARSLLWLLLLIPQSVWAADDLIVDLGYIKYKGSWNGRAKLNQFFGIKYAASPAGHRRWTAPRHPPTVEGVQEVKSYPACLQSPMGTAAYPPFVPEHDKPEKGQGGPSTGTVDKRDKWHDEDCLFLNILSPDIKARLPVLVWIHGGGYGYGGITARPDLAVNGENKAVVVSIQYRLGLFGFLAGSEIKKHGTPNAGLLDQQFALRWIREYISFFGGDPEQVTIWGESAGGGSVLNQVVANGGRTRPPLFTRAITSSSYLPFQYYYNDDVPEMQFTEVARLSGCSAAVDVMQCLRTVDSEVLETVNTNLSVRQFAGEYEWVPVIDGDFIQEHPIDALIRKHVNGESILAIANSNEGAAFVGHTPAGTVAEFVQHAYPMVHKVQASHVADTYEKVGYPHKHATVAAIMGESVVICPTYWLMAAFEDKAHKGLFAIPPGNHANDVAYYFTSMQPPFNHTDFVNSYSKMFMNVAINGDVNKKISEAYKIPDWPTWNERRGARREMLFNATDDLKTPVIHIFETDEALFKRCEMWKNVFTRDGGYVGWRPTFWKRG